MELSGRLHQERERRALEGDGEAAAQRGEVDAVAMEAGDHSEAGQPALGRLGLQEHGQAGARSELQAGDGFHQVLPARLSSGSNTHSISRRRSSWISASSCMPGCSGSARPYAEMVWLASSTLMR